MDVLPNEIKSIMIQLMHPEEVVKNTSFLNEYRRDISKVGFYHGLNKELIQEINSNRANKIKLITHTAIDYWRLLKQIRKFYIGVDDLQNIFWMSKEKCPLPLKYNEFINMNINMFYQIQYCALLDCIGYFFLLNGLDFYKIDEYIVINYKKELL